MEVLYMHTWRTNGTQQTIHGTNNKNHAGGGRRCIYERIAWLIRIVLYEQRVKAMISLSKKHAKKEKKNNTDPVLNS